MAARPGHRHALANMDSFISSGQLTNHDQFVAPGFVQFDVVDQVVLEELDADFGAEPLLFTVVAQVLFDVEQSHHGLGVFLRLFHGVLVGENVDRTGLLHFAAHHRVVFAQLALDVEDSVFVPSEATSCF